MKLLFKNGLRAVEKKFRKASYSQCGEDLIIDFILRSLKVKSPIYLDIGAFHSINLNNTYLFYKRGCRGVNIEPDPDLFSELRKMRPNDICLNCGCSDFIGDAEFFVLNPRTLNTFSEEEANRYINEESAKLIKKIHVPVVTIANIFDQYFEKTPDIVSIDVEGLETIILKSLDFKIHRPKVFCIETVAYKNTGGPIKNQDVIELLKSFGYIVWGDTYINTIFVDSDAWENR
jgi:FkbM family methyltransferase